MFNDRSNPDQPTQAECQAIDLNINFAGKQQTPSTNDTMNSSVVTSIQTASTSTCSSLVPVSFDYPSKTCKLPLSSENENEDKRSTRPTIGSGAASTKSSDVDSVIYKNQTTQRQTEAEQVVTNVHYNCANIVINHQQQQQTPYSTTSIDCSGSNLNAITRVALESSTNTTATTNKKSVASEQTVVNSNTSQSYHHRHYDGSQQSGANFMTSSEYSGLERKLFNGLDQTYAHPSSRLVTDNATQHQQGDKNQVGVYNELFGSSVGESPAIIQPGGPPQRQLQPTTSINSEPQHHSSSSSSSTPMKYSKSSYASSLSNGNDLSDHNGNSWTNLTQGSNGLSIVDHRIKKSSRVSNEQQSSVIDTMLPTTPTCNHSGSSHHYTQQHHNNQQHLQHGNQFNASSSIQNHNQNNGLHSGNYGGDFMVNSSSLDKYNGCYVAPPDRQSIHSLAPTGDTTPLSAGSEQHPQQQVSDAQQFNYNMHQGINLAQSQPIIENQLAYSNSSASSTQTFNHHHQTPAALFPITY